MIEPGDIETRAPFPGESLYGYVADVTGHNLLGRVAEIAGAPDRMYGHRPQLATTGWDDLPAIAAVLEVDVAELQLRSYPVDPHDGGRRAFFGTTVARGDLSTRVRRFSPAALAGQPFHRAMWQLRIPFDAETCEMLLSTCPVCRREQRWRHSAGVAFCDGCGESLQQPAETIDRSLQESLKLATGLTHTDPARRLASLAMLPDEVARLGPAMAYELLLRLIPVAEPSCTWRSADRIWHNDPHGIARGMSGAWHLMAGWPGTLTDRISSDLATATTRYADGNGGATRRFLSLRRSDFVALPVKRVIERLHQAIDIAGPLGAEVRRRTMNGTEVSRYLRLTHGTVVPLRRRGAFRTIGVARAHMLVPAFDRLEVADIGRDIRRRLDLNQANLRLGLPYYAVEQLCANGRLPLLSHPFFAVRYVRPQTTRDGVSALSDALIALRRSELEGAEEMTKLMRMVGGRLKPWDAVVEGMLDGGLAYVVEDGSSPLFRRVKARREDLIPYLRSPIARDGADSPLTARTDPTFAFDDGMTKQDAAEVLNLSREEASRILDRYFPAPDVPPSVGDVIALGRRFVTNAEIAARLGVSSLRVHHAAAAAEIARSCDAVYERTLEEVIVEATQSFVHRRPPRPRSVGSHCRHAPAPLE